MLKKTLCLLLAVMLLGTCSAFAEDIDSDLSASEAVIQFIKFYEGFSSTQYEDGGGLAIGYGTRCQPDEWTDGITLEQADGLMRADVERFSGHVNSMATRLNLKLSQHQFDALVSLTYNLGYGWMTSEYRLYTMLKTGISRYSDLVVVNAFARYSNYKGELFEPLIRRRLAEAKMFLYGDYRFGGTPNYEFEHVEHDDGDFSLYKLEAGLTISTFTDIQYKQWFYKYVSPLAYLGIIDGYSDGSFKPYVSVSSGEATKLLLLAAGHTEQATLGEHWADGYLALARAEGYLDEDEVTDLDYYIDRGLVAKLTALSLGLTPGGDEPFTDTDDIYVAALYNAGVVEGSYDADGNLVYKPDSPITRAEICAIIWRLINL